MYEIKYSDLNNIIKNIIKNLEKVKSENNQDLLEGSISILRGISIGDTINDCILSTKFFKNNIEFEKFQMENIVKVNQVIPVDSKGKLFANYYKSKYINFEYDR